MLQFANQPDLAYDMCTSIAPDCGPLGSYRSSETLTNEVKQPDYPDEPDQVEPEPDDGSDENDYDQFGRRRFIPDKNQSDNAWAVASTDLNSVRPYWQMPETFGISSPYAATDNGKIFFRLCETI